MTQTSARFQFPDEQILVIRPSFNTICCRVRPAAKVLSYLCYQYNNAKNPILDANGGFSVRKTQAELVSAVCDEMDVKTLHDTAIPWLLLLGFIDLNENTGTLPNEYIVYPQLVQEALNVCKQPDILRNWIKTHARLELFLIEKLPLDTKKFQSRLELFPIVDKKNFQSTLEKVLIQIRNNSNHKRGRKARLQAAADTHSENDRYIIDNKISNRYNIDSADASASAPDEWIVSPPSLQEKKQEETTDKKTTRRRKKADEDAAPEPLVSPPLDAKPTKENILQLAEFLRGYHYTPRSKKTMLQEGAIPLIEQKCTLEEIDLVWRFMSKDDSLRLAIGKTWMKDTSFINGGYNFDLNVLARHIKDKLLLIAKLEQQFKDAQTEDVTPPEQGANAEEEFIGFPQEPDEFGRVLWTTNPGYTGRRLRNDWRNFKLMPLDEAIKNGYGKRHISGADLSEIQINLTREGLYNIAPEKVVA